MIVIETEFKKKLSRFNLNRFPPVPVGGEQRDGGRLQPSHPHLKLHQRAGLGIPPAQPEERPPAQALRRPQVRREEDRGGGLRPVHPRAGQGGGAWVGKVVPEAALTGCGRRSRG